MAAERGEGVRYVALMTGVNCSSLIRPEARKGSLKVGSHKSTSCGERYGSAGGVDSTVGMVSRVDVYMIYVIKGFFFLAWVPCLHAGFERERASSGGIPQATKPTVDLKQKKETEKQRGTVGPLVDWERQGHRQTSARKRDWHLSTIAIVAALAWT